VTWVGRKRKKCVKSNAKSTRDGGEESKELTELCEPHAEWGTKPVNQKKGKREKKRNK